MLTKKQLEDALMCQDRDCNMCSLFVAGGYCATPAAETALAYRINGEVIAWMPLPDAPKEMV